MISAASASPTLSLVIRAPEALEVLAALRLGIKELKGEVAGLGSNFTAASTAGVARLEGQVNELTAALATTKLELSQVQQKLEAVSAVGIRAAQAEQQAIVTKNRVAREEAKKTAAVEEEATLRRLSSAEVAFAKLQRLSLTSTAPNTKQRLTGESLIDLENEAGANRAVAEQRKIAQARDLEAHRLTEAEKLRVHSEALAENAAIDNVRAEQRRIVQARDFELYRLSEAEKLRVYKEAAAQNAAIDKARAEQKAILQARDLELYKMAAAEKLAIERELAAKQRAAAAGGGGGNTLGGFARGGVRGIGGPAALTFGSTPAIIGGFILGAALSEAVKAGAEFQYQMTFTSSIINETAANAAAAGEEFKKLALNSQFSATEIAKGSRVLGQAGFDTFHDIVATLPTVLKLAAVGELEVSQAAEIAAGNMNAFGLTVSEIPNVANSLAKAAVLSQTNIKEMGEALKQVGPIAQQAGVGINDMNAILAVLATRNIRGSQAGTSLANVIRELIAPTDRGRDALRRIGVDAIDPLTGKMKAAVPLMQEFLRVFSQFDPQSQTVLTSEIFNNRASKGFVTALAEATSRLPDFQSEISKAYKEATFLDTVMDKLSHTFRFQAKEALNALQVAFIEAFEGSGAELTKLATQAKNLFTDKEFIGFITATVKGFATMSEYILKVVDGLAKTWTLMGALKALAANDAATAGNPNTFFAAISTALDVLIAKARSALGGTADRIIAEADKKNNPTTLDAAAKKRIEDAAAWEARGADELKRQKAVLAAGTSSGGLKFELPSKTIGAQKTDILSDTNNEIKRIEELARQEKTIQDKIRSAGLISEEEYQQRISDLEQDRIDRDLRATQNGLAALEKLEIIASGKIIGLRADETRKYIKASEAQQQGDVRFDERRQEAVLAAQKVEEENANQIRIRTAQKELQAHQERLQNEAGFQVRVANIERLGREKSLNDKQLSEIYKLKANADESLRKKQEQFDISLMPEYQGLQIKEQLAVSEQFYTRIRDIQIEIAKAQREAGPGQTFKLSSLRAELAVVEDLMIAEQGRAAIQLRANYDKSRQASTGIRTALQDYRDAATNSAAQYGGLITNIFKQAEVSLFNFFTTGKLGFRDFAKFAVQELLKIQIAKILAGVAGFASGFFFPATPTTSSTGSLYSGGNSVGLKMPASHAGGIVGLEHSFSRLFPKFHGGGIVGDEQMVIARKKEGIFTPAQMRALAPVGSGGSFVININVTNNGQGKPESTSSGGPDGLAQVINGAVVGVLVREMRPGGILSQVNS